MQHNVYEDIHHEEWCHAYYPSYQLHVPVLDILLFKLASFMVIVNTFSIP